MEVVNSLWVEKFRPATLDDMVLPNEYRIDFRNFINTGEVPHLLLAGSPGSGKTAFAMILCSKNGILQNRSDNLLIVNGSGKETRGISFVQDVIEAFVKVPPAGSDKYRIVFIDESDMLTDASYQSLRHIMEKYSATARFIFTCNYISKIPDALQSRFQTYIFKQMPIDFVIKYCERILKNEEIEFKIEDLKYIIDGLYPDIRKIVNTLQRDSSTKKLRVNRDAVLSNEKFIISNVVEIINFIQKNETSKINNSLNNIVALINEQDLDYRNIFSQLFFLSNVPAPAKILVNKYSNMHSDCLIPSMNFFAMIHEIIIALSKYNNIKS